MLKNSSRIIPLSFVLALGTSCFAYAQDTLPEQDVPPLNSEEQGTDPAAAVAEKRMALDEIVVTAQKRAEDIQEVPLSVSAVGGETLREKSIESLNDLARYTPNTQIAAGNGAGAFIKMRGLGSGNNKGFEQAVGLLIDGVYYGRIDYLTNAMVDLAQIEILRGPQGTLMGKNTIAGAVSISTVKPQNEWEVDVAYGVGEREKSVMTAILNVPVIDDVLALRFAAQRDRQDGYVENTLLNYDQLNTSRDMLRGKLGFDGIDNLSVVASFEYSQLKQRLWGFEINKATDQSIALNSAFDPDFEARADYRNQTDQDGVAVKESLTASITADYELGEYILTSVSGWSNLTFANSVDADFGPIPLLTLGSDDDWTQWSQEFRITSPIDTIDYVAGIYLFGSTYDTFSDLNLLEQTDPLQTVGGVLLPDFLGAQLGDALGITGPITEDNSYGDFHQTSFSAAFFGQLRWHLLDDDLTLMAGLRYSYEQKEADMTREFTSTGVVFMQALAQEEFVIPTRKRIEHDLSPKISATYAVTEDMNVYGTFAQAFKGGGFNSATVQADEFEFEEETANTYELGLKGTFLSGLVRVNMATFYTQFKNLQVSIFDGTKFVVQNAADATTKGVEADVVAMLAEGLIVNGSIGYTHARYDSFPNGPCMAGATAPCDLSGKELDRAPDWNGTVGFNWAAPVGNLPFEFAVGADANYQGDHYVNTDLDPNEFQDAYIMYNVRVALQDLEGAWMFQINGKNLSDEMVLMGGADVPAQNGTHMGTYGAPRTVSAEFRVRF